MARPARYAEETKCPLYTTLSEVAGAAVLPAFAFAAAFARERRSTTATMATSRSTPDTTPTTTPTIWAPLSPDDV